MKAAATGVFLSLLLLASPSLAQDKTDDNPFAGFETRILPNGLKVWYKRMPGQGTAAISVAVQVGSDSDPVGKEQLAHFLEHMQYSDHLGLSTQEIQKQIDDRGGVENAYTGQARTFYFVHIKKEHALFAVQWLYGIVSPHEMKPEVVERERHPVEVEVGAKPREALDWVYALYLNPTYLRVPGIWEREFSLDLPVRDFYPYRSLTSITPLDLKAFYKRYYSPARMTVTVIGDLDREAVFDLVDKTFATLQQAEEPPPAVPAIDVGRRRSTFAWAYFSDIAYARCIRFATMNARDEVMLTFIDRLLHKRLNDRLRFGERKAAYGISSGLLRRGPATYFMITGRIRPAEFTFATDVIDEEIEALKKGSLPDAAFESDRSAVIQQLVVSSATPENLEGWISNAFYNRNRHEDFPDLVSAFRTVTKEDVAKFASQHFVPEREFTATTYPFPLSQTVMGVLGVVLFLGTIKVVRSVLTRPVDMKRIRYVAHLRVPKVMVVLCGAVLVFVVAVGLRLLAHGYELFSTAFLDTRNSFVFQWSVLALLAGVTIAVIVLALSLVPSKILLFYDRLLIKYFAYRSVAIPLGEIADLSVQRFPAVWLSRRLWKCVPFKWGVVSPGLYLKRRDGWSYFFDVRDRDEFARLLTPSLTP